METITGNTSQAIQDETLLIRRILAGHKELFRQLAGRFAGQVLRMVASLIPSQEEAEEVTQDALLEAFQSLARFDARQANFQTWLMRIAYHTARQFPNMAHAHCLPYGSETLQTASQNHHGSGSGTMQARHHP